MRRAAQHQHGRDEKQEEDSGDGDDGDQDDDDDDKMEVARPTKPVSVDDGIQYAPQFTNRAAKRSGRLRKPTRL
jgi:hypothetical protein